MNPARKLAAGLAALVVATGLLVAQHGADASTPPTHDGISLAGYPNANNAGLPANPRLIDVPSAQSSGPGWHWSDSYGGVVIDGDGTLFKGFNVTGAVEVFAKNVNIEYDSISNTGNGWAVGIRPGSANTFVYRSNMQGPCNRCTDRLTYGVFGVLGGDSTNLIVARNNFSNIDHPLQQESGLVRGNYVHDLATLPNDSDHVDSFFSGGGQHDGAYNPLVIRHNTLLTDTPYEGSTSSIMLNNAFGEQHNRLIENNLLGGGGFVIYGGDDNKGHPAVNVVIRNNQFTTAYNPKGGFYGECAYTGGDTISGNTWHDGPNVGQPVPC